MVARKDSPMILGVADGESYVASDVPAILKYTRNVYYIGNLEMARVSKGRDHISITWTAMKFRNRLNDRSNGMPKQQRKPVLSIS